MKLSNFKKKFYMMKWAKDLFPFCRSLTGQGNKETFNYIINNVNKNFKLHYVRSNTKVFDWKIPQQWEIKNAYIKLPNGEKICQFKKNNLHIVNYSKPIKKKLSFNDLKKNLYFIKKKPNAIPYVTSYYKKNWGFCISYNQFKKLPKNGNYEVFIDSNIFNGKMGYMDLLIPGKSKKEILITSYICHPSMANNELSGPLVVTNLLNLIRKHTIKKKPNYTYRFLFLPETIGTIALLNQKFESLKKNSLAVFVITCVGTEKKFKLIASPYENTLSEKIAKQVLDKSYNWEKRSFLHRGSDERQWLSPHVSIDCCSIVTSKYGEYKEYHTSKDNLNFISLNGIKRSSYLFFKIFKNFEKSKFYYNKNIGEPKMDKHGIYPMISTKKQKSLVKSFMDILSFCNGKNNEKSIASYANLSLKKTVNLLKFLEKKKLIKYLK